MLPKLLTTNLSTVDPQGSFSTSLANWDVFDALDEARPCDPVAGTHFRVRTDKVDRCGKVTLRHDSKRFHIAIGRRWKGTKIRLFVAELDVRIVTFDGKLLCQLTLETTRTYQPRGLPRERVREGSAVPPRSATSRTCRRGTTTNLDWRLSSWSGP